jgi:hypothetical protein
MLVVGIIAATPASACPAGAGAAEPLPGEQDEPVDGQERPGRGGLAEDGPVQGVRIHPHRNASFSGSALTAAGLDDAGASSSQASGESGRAVGLVLLALKDEPFCKRTRDPCLRTFDLRTYT